MTNGGVRANVTGKILQNFVSAQLENAGYERIHPPEGFFAMREMQQLIYAEEVEVGRDIYGKERRVDFLIYHPRRWPDCLCIQCKWQASRGSVDEKFPFEVLSIEQNQYPTIIVLDGGGYHEGAAQWLRGKAGKGKLLHVDSQGDFQRRISRGQI